MVQGLKGCFYKRPCEGQNHAKKRRVGGLAPRADVIRLWERINTQINIHKRRGVQAAGFCVPDPTTGIMTEENFSVRIQELEDWFGAF
jgi:hypothetical protein